MKNNAEGCGMPAWLESADVYPGFGGSDAFGNTPACDGFPISARFWAKSGAPALPYMRWGAVPKWRNPYFRPFLGCLWGVSLLFGLKMTVSQKRARFGAKVGGRRHMRTIHNIRYRRLVTVSQIGRRLDPYRVTRLPRVWVKVLRLPRGLRSVRGGRV